MVPAYTTMDAESTTGYTHSGNMATMGYKRVGVDLDAMEQTAEVLFSKRVRAMCHTKSIPPEPTPLAELTGLGRQTCRKYLNAETTMDAIPAQYLFLLAEKLECSVRWLYLGEGAPWFTIARTHEENEVIKTMRLVPEKGREFIVEAARGELAKSKSAPDTGRFTPLPPHKAKR